MGDKLKHKVVVVTGGAKGIGYAVANEFLNEGAETVFIIDLDENQGNEVASTFNSKYGDGKAVFLKGDVTKDLDKIYNEIVSRSEHVDILVNNAGVVDEINIRRALEINTLATVEWSMKFLEHMSKNKGGRGGAILNMSSLYGCFIDEHAPFYKTTKHAIVGFSRTLGHDKNFKGTGVKVLVLCPGVTKTEMVEKVQVNEAFSFQDFTFQDVLNTYPSQEKEDVAKAAVEILVNGQSGSGWSLIAGDLQQLP